MQLAQALSQQGMSGAPTTGWGLGGRLASALAGAAIQGDASSELTHLYEGGIDAASKALPPDHPLQPYLQSKNPLARMLGYKALDKALIQLSEPKGLRPGETLQYPTGQPPVAANTGAAAAATEAAKNPPLIARAAGTAAAKAPYEGGGEAVVNGQTIPITAATRADMQPKPVKTVAPGGAAPSGATFNDRFSAATGNVKANDELQAGSAKDFVENSTKHYNAAQNLMGRLTTMDHNIEVLGPKWMGANANAKAEFGKQWNGMLDTLGVQGHHIDPTKIATWEEFNKESARAGMELINANFGGSREAASIIKMGTEAVPAAQQTYLGAKYNAASIKAAAQREIDLHEYKARLLQEGKPIVGADVAFNKTNPPQAYATQAIVSQIPPGAVAHLRSNPALAPQFDKQFGPGTAALVMGAR
jgi:hypothetical protein